MFTVWVVAQNPHTDYHLLVCWQERCCTAIIVSAVPFFKPDINSQRLDQYVDKAFVSD